MSPSVLPVEKCGRIDRSFVVLKAECRCVLPSSQWVDWRCGASGRLCFMVGVPVAIDFSPGLLGFERSGPGLLLAKIPILLSKPVAPKYAAYHSLRANPISAASEAKPPQGPLLSSRRAKRCRPSRIIRQAGVRPIRGRTDRGVSQIAQGGGCGVSRAVPHEPNAPVGRSSELRTVRARHPAAPVLPGRPKPRAP